MTYEQKVFKLSAYQRKKMIGVALRADLDYWETYSTAISTNDTGGGGGTHNTEHSPTFTAASRALEVREDIEKTLAGLLRDREKLISLFASMDDDDQSIMYLVYISGFSLADTAKYMGLTPNAVRKRHKKIIDGISLDSTQRKADNKSADKI